LTEALSLPAVINFKQQRFEIGSLDLSAGLSWMLNRDTLCQLQRCVKSHNIQSKIQRCNVRMVNVLTYKYPPVQLLSIEVHADQMEHRSGGGIGSSGRAENALFPNQLRGEGSFFRS